MHCSRSIALKASEAETKKVVFARLFEDEDLLETIARAAKENGVKSGFFFLIGTLKKAVLGYYEKGEYLHVEKAGPLEIASCTGNVSTKEQDELVVHGHIVVSDRTASAYGGHVLPGCPVDATAELVLVQADDGVLKREFDVRRNLYLWFFEEKIAT